MQNKKNFFIIVALVLNTNLIFSQGLDETTLKKIREDNIPTIDKGRVNAISNNDLKALVVNRETVGKAEHNFKYKVNVTGITDQKSSGRCWMFTALNSMRPKVINEKALSNFEFSQNYLYFYDLLEKSNLFLSSTIKFSDKAMDDRTVEWLLKNPLSDGGVWNSFANLVEKYGLVPKSVMPETYHSENTSVMDILLSRKLREDALLLRSMKEKNVGEKKIMDEKFKMISEIYKMLTYFLGVPPEEFEYRFVDKNNNIGDYLQQHHFPA